MSDVLLRIGIRAIGKLVATEVLERVKGRRIETEHEQELLRGTIEAAVQRVLADTKERTDE